MFSFARTPYFCSGKAPCIDLQTGKSGFNWQIVKLSTMNSGEDERCTSNRHTLMSEAVHGRVK